MRHQVHALDGLLLRGRRHAPAFGGAMIAVKLGFRGRIALHDGLQWESQHVVFLSRGDLRVDAESRTEFRVPLIERHHYLEVLSLFCAGGGL